MSETTPTGKFARTLRIRWPLGQTTGLSFVILLILIGLCETAARQPLIRSKLPPPSVGTPYPDLDVKLARLDTIAKNNGNVDCFLIGSSMVFRGIDPAIFTQSYHDVTGGEFDCFNMGIGGLRASEIGAITEIMVDQYQPRLVIYGVSARDYARESADTIDSDYPMVNTPWTRYHLGEFSIEGWLIEHSTAYRTYLSQPWQSSFREAAAFWDAETMPDGYGPHAETGDISRPPDPETQAEGYTIGHEYEVSRLDLLGLQRIMNLRSPHTEVVVVEMPLPQTYYYFFDNGEADYRLFVEEIERATEQAGVLFIRSHGQVDIPATAWWDYEHLNQAGAAIFTDWLGNQIGEAVEQGKINDPFSNRVE